LALPGPHGEASVPKVWVEEPDVPPAGAAVEFEDDDVFRLLLQAEAIKATVNRAADAMNVGLLCFTDPPCERRIAFGRRQTKTLHLPRSGSGARPRLLE
jgi:hypothetical protein